MTAQCTGVGVHTLARNARTLDPHALAKLLMSEQEWALLDVQEAGRFVEGHVFQACAAPYSRLELVTADLVPRMDTAIVVTDECGAGQARKAAARLLDMGYIDVSVLEGGNQAWAASGYRLFKGVHVPSKAFGEYVELTHGTPSIDPDELAALQASGTALLLLDGRTEAEHGRFTLPGSRCCPNAELAVRIGAMVESAQQLIVIHCAGRTRSIIGAETLRMLGLPNRVVALRNGTQGWLLSGRQLLRGVAVQPLPEKVCPDGQGARALAAHLCEQYAVPLVSSAHMRLMLDTPGRTTYVFDVRTEAEFNRSTVDGATHAPGGQLIQATDLWIGVPNARVVLVDDSALRAVVVARWLREMGIDASVLSDPAMHEQATKHRQAFTPLPRIHPREAAGYRIFDLRSSAAYRKGHHRGALWAMREHIGALVSRGDRVAFVCDEPRLGPLAAVDAVQSGAIEVVLLEGYDVNEVTPDMPPDSQRIDHEFFTAGRHDGDLAAARQYLSWETHLLAQMGPLEWTRLRGHTHARTSSIKERQPRTST